MRKGKIAWLALMAVAAMALVAVACGDDHPEGPPAEKPLGITATVEATPTEKMEATPTVEPTATEEPAPEPTEAVVPTEPPAPAAQTLDIAMVPKIRFDQGSLTAQAGATVTVRVDNQDDGIPHTFSVYTDSSASQPLAEGSITDTCTGPCSMEITFVAPEPGQYFFRCDVHPTQMTGTFIVE